MNIEVSDADILIESASRLEIDKKKRQFLWTLACEVVVWLAFIAFLAGLFFALKLSIELGLRVVAHEITEHTRMNRGF